MAHELAAEHAVTKIVVAFSAAFTMFTAGAVGFAMEMANTVLAAQVSDGLILLLAGTALTVGTSIFAYTFKKLMDVLQMIGDLRRDVAVLAKATEDLEERMNRWEA